MTPLLSPHGPARRPCCGVYVQQVNRLSLVTEQIKALLKENGPASIRTVRQAIKRKERMENWLAAHSHPEERPADADPSIETA